MARKVDFGCIFKLEELLIDALNGIVRRSRPFWLGLGAPMFRRFWKSEDGNYAVITGIMIVPLMAAVAGAIDYTSTLNKAGQLQNSLDASALAIATAYDLGMSDDELTQLGQNYYNSDMVGVSSSSSEAFEYDDELSSDLVALASAEGDEIFITARSAITHEGMLGALDWPVTRRSVVKIKRGPSACVLALDPSASSAVKIQGSTDVGLTGCVIAANSKSSTAVYRGGAALLSAACINTVGGTSGISSNSNVNLECSAPMENQYPSFDPLKGVQPPSYSTCENVPGGKNKTLSPGKYCNKSLSGDITLEPGSYVLDGGSINLGGNGSLKGTGVTIFLLGDADFSVNGNEVVQLTPPSSGPYAGITIFQEKSNTTAVTINGTSGSYVSGFVYAPGAHVFYAGNAEATASTKCLRIVGNTVEMTGNSDIKSDCTAELGGREMFASRYLSIVH